MERKTAIGHKLFAILRLVDFRYRLSQYQRSNLYQARMAMRRVTKLYANILLQVIFELKTFNVTKINFHV